jgi:hypothetical protein
MHVAREDFYPNTQLSSQELSGNNLSDAASVARGLESIQPFRERGQHWVIRPKQSWHSEQSSPLDKNFPNNHLPYMRRPADFTFPHSTSGQTYCSPKMLSVFGRQGMVRVL